MLDLNLFFFKTLLDWLSTFQNQSFSSFLDLLDYVIFILDFLTPVHFLCTRASLFLYKKNLITYPKKKIKIWKSYPSWVQLNI